MYQIRTHQKKALSLYQIKKHTAMLIVSSREFRDNQKKYFDSVDNGEQVIVQRG